MTVGYQRPPHNPKMDVTPLNPREKEQTDSVESLVDRQQYQKANECRYRVPLSKSDMVREHLSKGDPGDTEENSHHGANDVSTQLADPDLCYFRLRLHGCGCAVVAEQ